MPVDPSSSLSEHQAVKIWGFSGLYWYNFFSAAFPTALGVWLLVAGANEQNGAAPFITGIIVLAISAPMSLVIALSLLRPLVLTNRALKIPRLLRSIEIPLSDVSGVGLIYQYTLGSRSPSGWQLRVWNDAKPIRVGRWVVATWRRPRPQGAKLRPRTETDLSQPLAHEDSSYLGASNPGLVARRIYDQVLKAQGSNGKLDSSRFEKSIRYDPNQSNITAAWWSPDGTMGRASGLPTPKPSDQTPVVLEPVKRRRRALSVLVLFGGGLASLMVAGFIWDIQQSTSVHHPDGVQILIITVGAVALVLGLGLSVYFAVRLWRRPRTSLGTTRPTVPPLAGAGWSLNATPNEVSPSDQSVSPIPVAKPEIRRARQRVARLTLLTIPCYAAIGVLAPVMLGRTGYLPSGEVCAALLGPGSSHPSLTCDAWRHHQLLLFLGPAGVLLVAALSVIYFQVRAFKKLRTQQEIVSTVS